ncbi:uncharacterized protein [Palaemon carinicauda]|uniref:uncharacterized protein isoform X2 n=1 Tax=Palaemon carinicauda TaxID=392227 RepID=UPI0035B573EC
MKIWLATQTALILQMANLANGKGDTVQLDKDIEQWNKVDKHFNGNVCIYFRQDKKPNQDILTINHKGKENQDKISMTDYLEVMERNKYYFNCEDLEGGKESSKGKDCTKTYTTESSKGKSFTTKNPAEKENNRPPLTTKPAECDPGIREDLRRRIIVNYVLAALLFVSAILNSSLGTYVCCLARRHKKQRLYTPYIRRGTHSTKI